MNTANISESIITTERVYQEFCLTCQTLHQFIDNCSIPDTTSDNEFVIWTLFLDELSKLLPKDSVLIFYDKVLN